MNKYFDLLPSASKRKHSPEELVTNKLRRMTLNSELEASPVLRGKSARVVTRRNNRTRSLDPKQQLITRMLGDKRKDQ